MRPVTKEEVEKDQLNYMKSRQCGGRLSGIFLALIVYLIHALDGVAA